MGVQVNPALRITVQGIMQHPFFREGLPAGALEHSQRLIGMADVLVASYATQVPPVPCLNIHMDSQAHIRAVLTGWDVASSTRSGTLRPWSSWPAVGQFGMASCVVWMLSDHPGCGDHRILAA